MVSVSKSKCIGCGVCVSMAPNCFELKGDKAIVKKGCKCDDDCKQAAESCPVDAINI